MVWPEQQIWRRGGVCCVRESSRKLGKNLFDNASEFPSEEVIHITLSFPWKAAALESAWTTTWVVPCDVEVSPFDAQVL